MKKGNLLYKDYVRKLNFFFFFHFLCFFLGYKLVLFDKSIPGKSFSSRSIFSQFSFLSISLLNQSNVS